MSVSGRTSRLYNMNEKAEFDRPVLWHLTPEPKADPCSGHLKIMNLLGAGVLPGKRIMFRTYDSLIKTIETIPTPIILKVHSSAALEELTFHLEIENRISLPEYHDLFKLIWRRRDCAYFDMLYIKKHYFTREGDKIHGEYLRRHSDLTLQDQVQNAIDRMEERLKRILAGPKDSDYHYRLQGVREGLQRYKDWLAEIHTRLGRAEKQAI